MISQTKKALSAWNKKSLLVGTSVIATALYLCAPTRAEDGAIGSDEQIIRNQAVEYARSFAAHDAHALAGMWTEDGTFTDSNGQEHKGRAAIEAYFREGFGPASQTLDVAVKSVKFPASNVAIEEGTTRIASGPGMGSMGRYLVVHVKQNGNWLMQTAAETDCMATSSYEYLKDLDWLVGTWTIKDQQQSARLKVSWSKNKSFLVCRYLDGDKDTPIEELQIIGWDPASGHIVSWHFGADGGFACGKMWFDGKNWFERTASTEPSGKNGQALYKLTQIDKNNFAWQTSDRSIGGVKLPDSKTLTITRVDSQ